MNAASHHRTRLAGLGLCALFVILAGKGGFLALSGQAQGLSAPGQPALATRADIVDRNGELLATSVASYSLWANPRLIWDAEKVADGLMTQFPDLDRDALTRRLADRDKGFVWVKRRLTPSQKQEVLALGLESLDFREEPRRAYPRGALAGHVLGYINADGAGIAGLELTLNDRLTAGEGPVRLTLDIGAQATLEAELATAAIDYGIIGGAAILMETRTGEIRAIASFPPFDPNRAAETPTQDPSRLNRAISAVYELGSVFKPLTVAAALEAGAVQPRDVFDVATPLEIGTTRITDTHWIGATASLSRILAESSNIGTVRVNQALGARRQGAFLDMAGLTRRAVIELPGSAAPLIPATLDPVTAATVSYGHGLSVSPLAFLAAFSAFGNGGEMAPPTLVADADERPAPVRLMSAITAELVTAMMRDTVAHGTASRADVAGYRVAGKTGTAEKPVAGGYDKDRNVASLAAIFPASRPEYALIVTLDEPRAVEGGGMTASWNAAPVAGRIIERVAPLLGLAPQFEDLRPAGAAPIGRTDERSSL